MFYTYAHYKPNGELFYIGKGQGFRAYTKSRKNKHWQKIVEKYGKPIVQILANWNTEKEALDHEILLIDCFKSMGYKLANKSSGGEGSSGYKHTEESKLKMSESLKGRTVWNKGVPMSEDTRIKLKSSLNGRSVWNKGVPMSEEQKQKLSLAKKGKTSPRKGAKHTDETKLKMSKSHKGKILSEETRKKISVCSKNLSDETRKKLSEAVTNYWKTKKMIQSQQSLIGSNNAI
jgi:hypothetical protein